MAFSFQTLIDEAVPGSITVMYTSPALTKTKINAMTVVNTDSVARLISVYLKEDSALADATNVVLLNKVLAPGEAYSVYQTQNQVLMELGTIQAGSNAAGVVAMYASGTLETA